MESNMRIKGLTTEEVKIRVCKGNVNTIPKPPSRTLGEILRANIFTSYNMINLSLAVVVLLSGSFKNAFFAIIVIANIIVGAFQELKAKKILEKLSVISEKRVEALRNDSLNDINVQEIVLDDILRLRAGEQILVDCEMVKDNEIEVDESMITGETDPILKTKGDKLLSGSFVTSGMTYAKVIAIGQNTYAAKLANEAKKFKVINSKLQKDINKIFKTIMWIVFPIAILLIGSQLLNGRGSLEDSIMGAVSGVIGMIPEGLVLLTSTTFMLAVMRLAKWKTLVQELPATEVLARVDVLCLDKTGTITKGDLKVSEILTVGREKIEKIEEVIAAISHSFNTSNQTDKAILERFKDDPNLKIKNKIPFSSKRKWKAIEVENDGVWVLGAPEMILKDRYNEIAESVENEAKKGNRVILLAKVNGVLSDNLEGEVTKEALIVIEDIIRENAEEAIKYFKKQDVGIKIISGDNPVTVSAIAKKVGIENAESYVDAKDLPEDEEEFNKMVEKTCVFGRVTPHQKKRIVLGLKANKHTVAMTGDGVNDVLALKESDCGIAMAEGADATKSVAQLVLMNSDFTALPHVVSEGRQLINNLEKVSELFLTKTVYFIILAVVFALIRLPYPMIPIQMTLLGSLTIGIPSFFLSMSPNKDMIKEGFLKRVMKVAIPNGALIGISTIIMFIIGHYTGASLEECRTLAVATFGTLSMVVLLKVATPLNLYRLIIVASMSILFAVSFMIPFVRKFFVIDTIQSRYMLIIFGIASITTIVMILISKFAKTTVREKTISNCIKNKKELTREI